MPSDSPYQHPVIPPRTSSTGMTDVNHQGKPLHAIPEVDRAGNGNGEGRLPTNSNIRSKHLRRRSSMDGTKYRDGQWSSEKERILMGPYDYMLQNPGKDIRRQLINAFNVWLQVPAESIEIINKVVGMLHAASLLIDDVEDDSILRRGVPVAHKIYGTAQTINSANYVYFLALQELQKLNNPEAINIYVQELLNLHRGQGMDLFWRDTLTCPSEDEYLEMVGNKTGGLFRLAIKLMQAESQTGRDCVRLVNVLGLIFQICDDYLNLSNLTYTQNKGLAEDLTEGKFSFPIIHSIRSNPHNHQLINMLRQHTKDDEVKRYAISYMESTGSFAHTQQVVRDLRTTALGLIDEIGRSGRGNPSEGQDDGAMIRAIMDKMTEATLADTQGDR
ncbi:geranylgeranyl diphosphate synthase [Aspergillus campestris IBT 28561]|uniref:Geranylgeranyl diphosphate synthase n=1 Tax=Aspergillus campestris (strain IBT 28561) TaxID=1392248 RepID=A0A2I1DG79_ASPC2|nr:geranylgeranyl diphosphate synthase [Aspergillus campestris IBT 28561]PKY08876.1 geranylgeranyl diphosphate synthase [Aspergillus campestris IBT 28561]